MGHEIDLMENYPRSKRNVDARGMEKTEEHRQIARQFGKEFFDGDRDVGYGGFGYNSRFWEPCVPNLQKHFDLSAGGSVLDVGCAQGFMLYDFLRLIPGLAVKGLDISVYAIQNSLE